MEQNGLPPAARKALADPKGVCEKAFANALTIKYEGYYSR